KGVSDSCLLWQMARCSIEPAGRASRVSVWNASSVGPSFGDKRMLSLLPRLYCSVGRASVLRAEPCAGSLPGNRHVAVTGTDASGAYTAPGCTFLTTVHSWF